MRLSLNEELSRVRSEMKYLRVGQKYRHYLSRKSLRRFLGLGIAGIILFPLGQIPIRRMIATRQAPAPEAILILGGDPKREEEAAKLAQYYPKLDIWLSSGQEPEIVQALFRTKGISAQRLHLDYRASDTVTNFTTLVSKLKENDIQHVYLMTSDFHMPRAKAIALIVLGSRGIYFTPIVVPSTRPKESGERIFRDICRSLLWIYTGWTGV